MHPIQGIEGKAKTLTIHLFRYNPQDPASTPRLETYTVEDGLGVTLFFALNEIREKYASSLQVDFFCTSGYCGSCSMVINGRPGLACKTLAGRLGEEITLLPLPGFAIIGDLSIDMSRCIEGIGEKLEAWVQEHDQAVDIAQLKEKMRPRLIGELYQTAGGDLHQLEVRLEPELAEEVFKLQSCIDCGCCVATHGILGNKKHFSRQAELKTLAVLDTRYGRYELVSDGHHVFGLVSSLECENICPKQLPLDAKAAYMIRKTVDLQND